MCRGLYAQQVEDQKIARFVNPHSAECDVQLKEVQVQLKVDGATALRMDGFW